MFGQPVIILSKPIISAKILDALPAPIDSEHRLNTCGNELISHTQINPNSDENTFDEQRESDPIIVDLEVMLDVLREQLHLNADVRGRVVGSAPRPCTTATE